MKAKHDLRRVLAVPVGAIVMAASGGTAAVRDAPRPAPSRQERAVVRAEAKKARPRPAVERLRRAGAVGERGPKGTGSAPDRAAPEPQVTTTTSLPPEVTRPASTTTVPTEHESGGEVPTSTHDPDPAPEPEPEPDRPGPRHVREDSAPVPEAPAEQEPSQEAAPAAVPAEDEPTIADTDPPGVATGAGPSAGADLADVFAALPAALGSHPEATANAIADAFSDPQGSDTRARASARLVAASQLGAPPAGTDVAVAAALADVFADAASARSEGAGSSLARVFDAFGPAR